MLSGEEEEETQSSADDLTPSVTSHEASDLFPKQSGRRCLPVVPPGLSKALVVHTEGPCAAGGRELRHRWVVPLGCPVLGLSSSGVPISLACELRLSGFGFHDEGLCWFLWPKACPIQGQCPQKVVLPRRPGSVRFSKSCSCVHVLCFCHLAGPGMLLLPGEAWHGGQVDGEWVEAIAVETTAGGH